MTEENKTTLDANFWETPIRDLDKDGSTFFSDLGDLGNISIYEALYDENGRIGRSPWLYQIYRKFEANGNYKTVDIGKNGKHIFAHEWELNGDKYGVLPKSLRELSSLERQAYKDHYKLPASLAQTLPFAVCIDRATDEYVPWDIEEWYKDVNNYSFTRYYNLNYNLKQVQGKLDRWYNDDDWYANELQEEIKKYTDELKAFDQAPKNGVEKYLFDVFQSQKKFYLEQEKRIQEKHPEIDLSKINLKEKLTAQFLGFAKPKQLLKTHLHALVDDRRSSIEILPVGIRTIGDLIDYCDYQKSIPVELKDCVEALEAHGIKIPKEKQDFSVKELAYERKTMTQVNSSIKSVDRHIEDLNKAVEDAQSLIQRLKHQISEAEKQRDDLKSQNISLAEAIASLEDELGIKHNRIPAGNIDKAETEYGHDYLLDDDGRHIARMDETTVIGNKVFDKNNNYLGEIGKEIGGNKTGNGEFNEGRNR